MAALRDTPYPGMNFLVDVGTEDWESVRAGVWEVAFPDACVQVLEYRNGNEQWNATHKLQTTTRYSNLILRRGVIGSLSWYDWWDAARQGDPAATRTVTVALLNEDRSEHVLTWRFLGARPVCHRVSPLNAVGTEPLVESLEIAFEHFEMA